MGGRGVAQGTQCRAARTRPLSGIALARHESSAKAHPGVVGLKEAILVAMIVLLGSHAYVRGRNARLAASALMLVLTLAAILAGAWLTQS